MHISRVLVVGGGGFIGHHITKALRAAGHSVVVLDVVGPQRPRPEMEWLVGSISDSTLVASAATGMDSVIFLANASLPGSSQGSLAREAEGHVAVSLQVAEACKDAGVQRFLFASSGGAVYGMDAPDGGLSEDAPCRPLNAYGVSKLAVEHYLRLMGTAGPMRTLSLRIANPYGEGQRAIRAQGVIAAAMQHAMAGTAMPVWGDGSVERDFVYVSDVADAFVAGLTHEGPSSVLNIGSGGALSINTVLALVRAATERELKVDYLADRPIDVHRNALDISRAEAELNWRPTTSLDEGMARTAAWWRDLEADS